MKILMLAEDPSICKTGSNARKRIEAYAGLFDELHVIVAGGENLGVHPGRQNGALFLYPIGVGNPLFCRWHMYTRARSLAKNLHFDVVSAQGPNEIGLIAYWIARRFGVRLQLQVHTDVLSPWYRGASGKERLRYWLARFLLPRADCIRVVSQRIKRSLVSGLGISESKISVLPIFSDLQSFYNASAKPEDSAHLKEYSFKMIAIGRFVEKEKNFSMLIDMMRELIKKEPRAALVLVGEGPDRKNYESRVRSYRLEKNIIIEPWRTDLASLYKCFDVLLISSRYEGWGLVAIEAMGAAIPVLMTDVGLAGEVVQDGINGRVVPVENGAAFLDACLDLCKHPEKRRAFADAARLTVAEMKPQSEIEYLNLYRKSFECCVPKKNML